jgi:TfoX/Sxy family transcriptional regulator of competence genes
MVWQKSSPELIACFGACLPDDPLVERRQMFGYPCAFVNGNMFVGLHEQNLIVRLSERDRDRAVVKSNAKPFAVNGRTMREYIAITDAPKRDPNEVAKFVKSAFDYAIDLAPKIKKENKAKAAKSKVSKRD